MFKPLAPCDLDPIAALAAAAFIMLAIFAWTAKTAVADPADVGVAHWGWKLWQIGPLVMGFVGVWWFWLSTRRVAWVRSLALAVLALGIVVFANAYFLNVGVLWSILDPVRMLTELTWAAVANKANVARPDATG